MTGPDGQPYVAKQVVFGGRRAGSGDRRRARGPVVEDKTPAKLVYDPCNPLADGKGYVKMPNVDVVSETVNSMAASRSYQANVEVLNTVKSMMMKTLTMGQ